MAKEKKVNHLDGFAKSNRNRGEDIGTPQSKQVYDYRPENQYTDRAQERAVRRHEIRAEYDDVYQLEQERNQRAFERTRELRNEFYGGLDPRRKIEIAEGGMVREDQQAMANLPRQAIHCEYPQAPFYTTPYIDDTRRGTDPRRDDDMMPMSRYRNVRNQYDR